MIIKLLKLTRIATLQEMLKEVLQAGNKRYMPNGNLNRHKGIKSPRNGNYVGKH